MLIRIIIPQIPPFVKRGEECFSGKSGNGGKRNGKETSGIDEADSLLSKRLLNVTQGSEQAINSMRSQLLICLEQFHGTVIFATNLIENYDKAFETRIQHVAFKMPDVSCREKIWKVHLPPELPLEPGLSTSYLAESIDDVCGRDIKNAVIRTAVHAAIHERKYAGIRYFFLYD